MRVYSSNFHPELILFGFKNRFVKCQPNVSQKLVNIDFHFFKNNGVTQKNEVVGHKCLKDYFKAKKKRLRKI